jgi:predicted GIY-YIG superfamily endonuclease
VTPAELDHYVYRLYDDEGVLLYAGCTKNPGQRMTSHARTKSWWRQVSSREFEGPYEKYDALERETAAIHYEEPLYSLSGHQVGLIAGHVTWTARRLSHAEGRRCSLPSCRRCIAEFIAEKTVPTRKTRRSGRAA